AKRSILALTTSVIREGRLRTGGLKMATRMLGIRSSVLTGAALAGLVLSVGPLAAQTPAQSALTGKVTSQAEGAMEGVLVSAKRAGSTMTVTVVSDAQGRYSFPRERLEPGKYAVTIRAVGYELPAPLTQVDVTARPPAAVDLNLVKTTDLHQQLSDRQ